MLSPLDHCQKRPTRNEGSTKFNLIVKNEKVYAQLVHSQYKVKSRESFTKYIVEIVYLIPFTSFCNSEKCKKFIVNIYV